MSELKDWVPYRAVKEHDHRAAADRSFSVEDWERMKKLHEGLLGDPRPLALLAHPGDADSTLLVWRGAAIGAVERISIDVSEGYIRVIIVRRLPPEADESEESRSRWAEIAASGIIVKERR